jgi:thiamine kinase-like enzyme
MLRICGDLMVEIEFLTGTTPVLLTPELATQLGRFASKVHRTGHWSSFGYLDSGLRLHGPFDQFSDFVRDKITQWMIRLPLDDRILVGYVDYCWSLVESQKVSINLARPVFCHGDFVLKNILTEKKNFAAMIDWEDAGILCLEWEIRKLISFFSENLEVRDAFVEGYGEVLAADSDRIFNVAQNLAEIDLLGHAGWCFIQERRMEYQRTLRRMEEIMRVGADQ